MHLSEEQIAFYDVAKDFALKSQCKNQTNEIAQAEL